MLGKTFNKGSGFVEELLKQGKPLGEYLEEAEEGIKRKVQRLYERAREVDLDPFEPRYRKGVLFSEFWCPDCLVLAAALRYVQEETPQMEIKVLKKEGFSDILSKNSADGKARIPLLIVLDEEGKKVDHLSEVPFSLRGVTREEKGHRDYRVGKYMAPLLEELKGMLTR